MKRACTRSIYLCFRARCDTLDETKKRRIESYLLETSLHTIGAQTGTFEKICLVR
jgi:hypothetical protein